MLNGLAVLVVSLIASSGLADVAAGVALLTLVPGVLLTVRALRMGVEFDRGSVRVRNLLATTALPSDEVDGFEIRPTWYLGGGFEVIHLVRASGGSIPITVLALPQPRVLQRTRRGTCEAMNLLLESMKDD